MELVCSKEELCVTIETVSAEKNLQLWFGADVRIDCGRKGGVPVRPQMT